MLAGCDSLPSVATSIVEFHRLVAINCYNFLSNVSKSSSIGHIPRKEPLFVESSFGFVFLSFAFGPAKNLRGNEKSKIFSTLITFAREPKAALVVNDEEEIDGNFSLLTFVQYSRI